jgi:hypothetical protein
MPPRDRVPVGDRDAADCLEAEAHELIARAHLMLARAARLRATHPGKPEGADDLVPLSESGLGVRTRRRLEREGRLPVVKLGRQKFTRRSALLELVGEGDAVAASATPEVKDPREAARARYNKISGRRADGGL